MNLFGLVRRRLRTQHRGHHWIVAAVALAAAAVSGATLFQYSMRRSLEQADSGRWGPAWAVVGSPHRRFDPALSGRLGEVLDRPVAALIETTCSLQVVGQPDAPSPSALLRAVDPDEFAALHGEGGAPQFDALTEGAVLLSPPAAESLGVSVGDEIGVRTGDLRAVSGEVRFVRERPPRPTILRVRVAGVLADDWQSRSLRPAELGAVPVVYLSRSHLCRAAEVAEFANRLLVAGEPGKQREVRAGLERILRLADLGYDLRLTPDREFFQLVNAAGYFHELEALLFRRAGRNGELALSTLCPRLSCEGTEASQVIVTATDATSIRGQIRTGETVITESLAAEFGAERGSLIRLHCGPEHLDRREITDPTIVLVQAVVPDRTGFAPGPGFADAGENPRRAFVTMETALSNWATHYGTATSLLYPSAEQERGELEHRLQQKMRVVAGTLAVRTRGDMPVLSWRGYRVALITAAGVVILIFLATTGLVTALLRLDADRRLDRIRWLSAAGFTISRIRDLLVKEAMLLVLRGTVVGVVAGVLVCAALCVFVTRLWHDPFGAIPVRLHLSVPVVLWPIGLSLLGLFPAVRRAARSIPVRGVDLLLPPPPPAPDGMGYRRIRWPSFLVAALCLAGALGILLAVGVGASGVGQLEYLLAGLLATMCGIQLVDALLIGHATRSYNTGLRPCHLARRAVSEERRPSVRLVAVLAFSVFLMTGPGGTRFPRRSSPAAVQDSGVDADRLLYTESPLPVYRDLSAALKAPSSALAKRLPAGLAGTSFRGHGWPVERRSTPFATGIPPLIGVAPDDMADLPGFSFVTATGAVSGKQWRSIEGRLEQNEIPVLATRAALRLLGARAADRTVYVEDHQGRLVPLRIVGRLDTCVFEGALVMSRENLLRLRPEVDGYAGALLGVPAGLENTVCDALSEWFDPGCSPLRTIDRSPDPSLDFWNTARAAGQWVLCLTCIAWTLRLGVTVLDKAQRQPQQLGELQLMGFSRRGLRILLFREHAAILGYAMAAGSLGGMIVMLPALVGQTDSFSVAGSLQTSAVLLICGVVILLGACVAAVPGHLPEIVHNGPSAIRCAAASPSSETPVPEAPPQPAEES